ncbi:MAG: RagB/SusD family nutrient uptake outer membrane protein [Mangrovibacterium sp.]
MKKHIIFICTIVMFMYTIVSCDDYLKVDSNSTFTEVTAFNNLDFATKAVSAIYADFTLNYMYDIYFLYYKTDNDIEFRQGANNGSTNDLSHYAANEGNTLLKSIWNVFYSAIEKANICIDNLPQSPIWKGEYAEDAKCLYGEAVALRAQLYYELISLWGDVPFITKSTQAGDNFYVAKTDRDSIYEYLIQDLKDVEDYVPWMTTTQSAKKVSKGFVKGLRARMALSYAGYSLRNRTFETRRGRFWEDYYKIAHQECKEIMESGKHELNPGFENVFKKLHAYEQDLSYGEVLWQIPHARLYSGRLAYIIGMQCNVESGYGQTSTSVYTSPMFYYSFDRNDSRRNVTVELYNYGSATTPTKQVLNNARYNWGISKWRKPWLVPNMGGELKNVALPGIDNPIMRYSDILLMFAESENEINGPSQAAKDALSLVRKRAFPEEVWTSKVINYVDSVSQSKDAFFNAIVDERAWEFCGEMHRKNDLIRWNLLGSKIGKLKDDWQKIMRNDPAYANLDKVPTYLFWKYRDDGVTIDFLNPDYRMSQTSVPGYTRASWTPLSSESAIATVTISINNIANGYDQSKNNHLYPIQSDIITASNGVLSNDQIP